MKKQHRLLKNYSSMTDGTESFQSDMEEESRFVDVTINILGLTHGIFMETSRSEGKKINEGFTSPLGDQPVRAVVSGFKDASSQISHITSIPLKEVNSELNPRRRLYEFMALWPSNPEDNCNQSSMTFNRRIKRSRIRNSNEDYSYRNEKLTLAVSLMKGYEIITLGQVNIPFIFSKESTHVQLPVRTTVTHVENAAAEMKGIKLRRESTWKTNMKKNKIVQPLAFSDDTGRAYRFHEDSLLSVLVKTKLTFDKMTVNKGPRKELVTKGITPLRTRLNNKNNIVQNNVEPKNELMIKGIANSQIDLTNKKVIKYNDMHLQKENGVIEPMNESSTRGVEPSWTKLTKTKSARKKEMPLKDQMEVTEPKEKSTARGISPLRKIFPPKKNIVEDRIPLKDQMEVTEPKEKSTTRGVSSLRKMFPPKKNIDEDSIPLKDQMEVTEPKEKSTTRGISPFRKILSPRKMIKQKRIEPKEAIEFSAQKLVVRNENVCAKTHTQEAKHTEKKIFQNPNFNAKFCHGCISDTPYDEEFSCGETLDEDDASKLIPDAFVSIDEENSHLKSEGSKNLIKSKSSNGSDKSRITHKDLNHNYASHKPDRPNYLTYSTSPELSNLSSATMNSYTMPQENSQAFYNRMNEHFNDDQLPMVRVRSNSLDKKNDRHQVAENNLLSSSTISYLSSKIDSLSTSSWTFATWNHITNSENEI